MNLSEIVKNKSVLIVGSAPCVDRKIVESGDFEVVIFVNGSNTPFPHVKPDVTVMNGYTAKAGSDVAKRSMSNLGNRDLGHAVFLTRGLSFDDCKKAVAKNGSTVISSEEFPQQKRVKLMESTLGRHIPFRDSNDTPSTGVSAILLTLSLDPEYVAITGFSTSGGHSYINGDTPRGHAEIDAEVLSLINPELLDLSKC